MWIRTQWVNADLRPGVYVRRSRVGSLRRALLGFDEGYTWSEDRQAIWSEQGIGWVADQNHAALAFLETSVEVDAIGATKSRILTTFSESNLRLCGLMSRCTLP